MTTDQPASPVANATPGSRSRISELDALRGLAALGVVIFHFTGVYDATFGHRADIPGFELGQRGVQLFFMLSGFVIFMSLDRVDDSAQFVRSRAVRLYPAFWASILLTAAVVGLFGLPGRETGWWEALANVTMIHRWLGVADVDGVYWTLAVELGFYALMFGMHRLRVLDRVEVLGGVVVFVTFWLVGFDATNGDLLGRHDTFRLFLGSLHLFYAGILLYRLPAHHSPRAVGLLAFCVVVEAYYDPHTVAFVALAGGVLGYSAHRGLPALRFRPLLFLGAIAYPLYLLHMNIGFVMMRGLYGAGIEHPVLVLGIPTAAVIALASAVHYAVELPAQRWIRARIRRDASSEAPVASPELVALPLDPAASSSAVTGGRLYNAPHARSSDVVPEEAPPWRQSRRPVALAALPSPAPATTSRT